MLMHCTLEIVRQYDFFVVVTDICVEVNEGQHQPLF